MIEEIRRKIQRQQYEYSLHAADQSVLRHIARREVEEALESCLVLGYTKAGRPLHVQCTHPVRARIKIITVYEPDPGEWVDFTKRSRQ
jgi:hypothetical protein